MPRLRSPGHGALPCLGHSGPLRQRVRVALGPAGLSRGFRGVLERALRCRLVPVRPHANVVPGRSGAHRHWPGRCEVAFCTSYEEVKSDAPQVWISGDGDATGPITTSAVITET